MSKGSNEVNLSIIDRFMLVFPIVHDGISVVSHLINANG